MDRESNHPMSAPSSLSILAFSILAWHLEAAVEFVPSN